MNGVAAKRLAFLAALCLGLPGLAAGVRAADDVVLAIEGSSSMAAGDAGRTTRRALQSFAVALKPDDRLAVVMFGEKPRLLHPLGPPGPDALSSLPQEGSQANIAVGLERALYELKRNGRADAARSVVLVTDGGVDTGDRTLNRVLSEWMTGELADEASQAGIRVFGVGLTDDADFRLLQTLAQKTGAAYFRASTPEETSAALSRIHSELANSIASTPTATDEADVGTRREAPVGTERDDAPSVTASRPAPSAAAVERPRSDARQETEVASAPVAPPPETPAKGTPEPTLEPAAPSGIPESAAPAAQRGIASDWLRTITNAWRNIPEPKELLSWLRQRLDILAVAGAFALLIAVTMIVSLRRARRGPEPPSRGYSVPPAGQDAPDSAAIPLRLIDCGKHTGRASHEFQGRRVTVGRGADDAGRKGAALVINADTVSRRHAAIEYRDGNYHVRDCDSVNGTYVNGKRIRGDRRLANGDRVRFGECEFEVMLAVDNAGAETVAVPTPGAAAVETAVSSVASGSSKAEAATGNGAPVPGAGSGEIPEDKDRTLVRPRP
ncbi:MAG: FHA domain-containing protein [Ectothiorhodospiraceae bacterium]|jgi:hypothetical protein